MTTGTTRENEISPQGGRTGAEPYEPGSEADFERLYRNTYHRILGTLITMVRDRATAEDCAQETFERAYRTWKGWQPDAPVEAWLHRIAINVARNRHRGLRPRLVELNGSEQDTSPGPEARALRQAQLDDVTAALAGLPPRYREAVVLRYVQDLSYDEAAQVLGQPVGTVKSNVHRALKLLRGENHDRADD